MSGVRPELIFIAGPQTHTRAVLMNNEVIAGRSVQAGICLQEPYVSREQMKFTLTSDGWIVENLSGRRILINNKAFKPGKQILLASGDVVGCGQETAMLFVDAQDDPAEVLDAYRRDHPDSAPQPVPVPPPPAVEKQNSEDPPTAPIPSEPEPEVFSFEPERRGRKTATTDSTDVAVDVDDAGRKKKRLRLYLIGFGIYAMVMLVVIVVLGSMKDDDGPSGRGEAPSMLTEKDVRNALESSLDRPPNAERSRRALEQAQQYYIRRTVERGNLYRVIKNYRLYLAHRRAAERTFPPSDEQKYFDTLDELTGQVMNRYGSAYALEQAGKWQEALDAFGDVLDYFPADVFNDDPEVKRVIIQNIRDHSAYVSDRLADDDED